MENMVGNSNRCWVEKSYAIYYRYHRWLSYIWKIVRYFPLRVFFLFQILSLSVHSRRKGYGDDISKNKKEIERMKWVECCDIFRENEMKILNVCCHLFRNIFLWNSHILLVSILGEKKWTVKTIYHSKSPGACWIVSICYWVRSRYEIDLSNDLICFITLSNKNEEWTICGWNLFKSRRPHLVRCSRFSF